MAYCTTTGGAPAGTGDDRLTVKFTGVVPPVPLTALAQVTETVLLALRMVPTPWPARMTALLGLLRLRVKDWSASLPG